MTQSKFDLEEEMVVDKCWTCRRLVHELENLGIKFTNCETCKDTIIIS